MFGYTKPLICELKVGEHNFYKSIYCGLCRTIKKNYSNLVAIFLSYELVFFSIFALNFLDNKIEFEKKICPLHPLRKKSCLKQCSSLNVAADLTVLFSYFKLIDQLNDEKNFLKKFTAKIGLLFIKKHFKKAQLKQQNFAKIIQNFMTKQAEIEKKPTSSSIDRACHPTAECLGLIFEKLSSQKNEIQNLKQFGYFLGRFIYLIDALDDLSSDLKSNNFNPFLNSEQFLTKKQHNLKDFDQTTKNKIFKKAFYTINLTLSQLIKSYSSINLKKLKSITDNIILLGLMTAHKRIFKKYDKLDLFKQLIYKNYY